MARNNRGGRPPTPTKLKIVRGNPGKRDLPENEPQPEVGMPDCPEQFSEAQKKAFADFGEQLLTVGVLTKLDGPALQLLALAYDRTMQSAAEVAKMGPAWVSFTDCIVRDAHGKAEMVKVPESTINPHWKIQVEAMKRLHAMLVEFGMTPSSRVKVQTVGDQKPESIATRKRGVIELGRYSTE